VANDIRALLDVHWGSSSWDMAADAFQYSNPMRCVSLITLSHDSNVGIKGINFLLHFDGCV
jgi:hypothetical protein